MNEVLTFVLNILSKAFLRIVVISFWLCCCVFFVSAEYIHDDPATFPKIMNVRARVHSVEYINECIEIKDLLHKYGKATVVSERDVITDLVTKMYLEKNKEDYDIIWFFDCEKDLDEQMRKFGEKINDLEGKKIITEAKPANQIMQYLQTKTRWLLVFDNLNYYRNFQVRKFTTWVNKGHILFGSVHGGYIFTFNKLPHPLKKELE